MEQYVPDMYVQSIYKINYNLLKDNGIKCLIFDLNNTLVPPLKKDIDEDLIDLFNKLKVDFKVVIVSNSSKKRVQIFKDALDVDAAALAFKPGNRKIIKLIDLYKFKTTELAIIGDMITTDIFCGNRTNIYSILVNGVSTKGSFFDKILSINENKKRKKLEKMKLLIRGNYYE